MSQTKQCSRCKNVKPVEEFAVRSDRPCGRQSRCRKCQSDVYQENREHNLAVCKIYRETIPEIIKERKAEYYRKNVGHITERVKNYRQTERGKEVNREIARRLREKHPDKIMARSAVYLAIRDGRLVPQPCEICGATTDIEAHHESYAPEHHLDVNWLCPKHHKHLHMNLITLP